MVENIPQTYQYFHKLVILGDRKVGKSSLVNVFKMNKPRIDYIPSECIF